MSASESESCGQISLVWASCWNHGGMVRNTRKVRFSIIASALVVALAASVAAFRTKNPGWLAGLATMVTLILWVLDKRRGATLADRQLLDKVHEELRAAVLRQWSTEVGRRVNHPYPLPVPFTVLEKAKIPITHKRRNKVDEVRIMDGWGAIRGKPDGGPVDLDGTFESIVAVFTKDELPRRLVILGAPGSGKSIIAQWLTVKLIEDGRDNSQVPVFLPLASWNPAVSLDDWAAAEMARMYRWLSRTIEVVNGKPRSLAQELIAEGRVLMVLDGLDEIPEDNQAKALDRLTEVAKEQYHFVVTCRTGEYARIVAESAGPLKKTPVLALGTLPVSEVARYLRDAVIGEEPDRWDEFLTKLKTEPDSALATALSMPLSLS
jgi:hypothetical protein